MKVLRSVLAAAVVAGVVSLAGCAANPDLTPLETELAGVDGIDGAIAWPTHPGAPWNTQVNLLLFMEDPSDAEMLEAVRAAAPVLAADATAGRNPVTVRFVDGDRADYADRFEATGDGVLIPATVYEALGLRHNGGERLMLSPADVQALTRSR